MVAVVAGNGLGLLNTSNALIGSLGMLGQSGLGVTGRSFVNAATGNLVLQFQDEQLSGLGADLLSVRTYNSQGLMQGDGLGSGWAWDAEATVLFSGGTRNAGGTVTRTTGDGHTASYSWDGSKYVSAEGDGAHDTMRFDTDTSQWIWTDGSTRTVERYSDSSGSSVGRLLSRTDPSGNTIAYSFDTAGRLTGIQDVGSGQRMAFGYTTVGGQLRLTSVDTFEQTVDASGAPTGTVGGTAIRQLQYGYDSTGRLVSVKTVLNPGQPTQSLYVTAYTYDGTSSRVASISQSDGTNAVLTFASFTYEQASNGTFRVKTVTDSNGTLTFTYSTASNNNSSTRITDATGLSWTFWYMTDSSRLVEIDSPGAGGTQTATLFEYDASGNLVEVNDWRNDFTYEYDDRGNRVHETDILGNQIWRRFDPTTNQLLAESHFTGISSGGSTGSSAALLGGGILPAGALTTRYVYDDKARLRFVVSPEGRVTENRYSASGLLLRTISYAASAYDVSALGVDDSPTEAQMSAWVAQSAVDKSRVTLVQLEYDLLGNLSRRTDFANVGPDGEGIRDAGTTVTEFVRDAHGQLVKTIAVRGTQQSPQKAVLSSFTYDGLGREISRTTADGTQITAYDDAHRRVEITSAANLKEVRTYDALGHLTSVSRTDLAAAAPPRAVKYVYDADGRVQIALSILGQDSQGNDVIGARRFSFYDATGRLEYSVESTGAVTRFEYNASGQVIARTGYANRVDTTAWTASKTTVALGAGGDLVPDPAHDRRTTFDYDADGRLTTQTDAANVATTTVYDGASRVLQVSTGERVTRFFYDDDGLQIGVVDPMGYLTESRYDAAGRLVETIRYATRSPMATDVSAPVWAGVSDQSATGGKLFTYQLPAASDADGDALTYSVVGTLPTWLSFDSKSLTLRGTPPTTLTNYTVTLRASDGRGRSTDVTFRITVANSAPSWNAPLPDATVATGTANFSLVLPAASDVESSASQLVYSIVGATLPPGLSFNASTRTISGTPTAAGTYAVTVRVTDPQGLYTERTFVLQVTNRGPIWASAPTGLVTVRGQAFNFVVPAAVDPEGGSLVYRAASLPGWLTFDPATRTLSGTPSSGTPLGPQTVVLQAIDTSGETTQLVFSVSVTNNPPTWASFASPHAVRVGHVFDFTPPAAVDPEGDSITYSATGLPPGLQIDPSNGHISGTRNDVGTYNVTLTATDSTGASVSRAITVGFTNSPPGYDHGLPDMQIMWGVPTTWTMPADAFLDPAAEPLGAYFLASAAPSGFVFNSYGAGGGASMHLLSTATIGTVYPITIGVKDASGFTGYHTFYITIVAQPPPPPPPPPPAGDPPPPTPPGGGGNPRPPVLPQVMVPGGTAASVARTPIPTAPAPVLGLAQTTTASPSLPAAPRPRSLVQGALTSAVDVLASWRPSNTEGLHGYRYYDAQGRVTGTVDESGFLTETVYDAQGNTQQNIRYMSPVTVAVGDTLASLKSRAGAAETSSVQFDALGRVSASIAVDGTVTRNEYDGAGRLVRQVMAAGTADQRAMRTRYDAFGDVTGSVGGVGDAWLASTAGSSVDGAITKFGVRYEYDALGRRVKATEPDVTNADGTVTPGSVTLFYYDTEGRLRFTVDAKGDVSETRYDAFGQVQSTRRYAKSLPSGQTGLTGGVVTSAFQSQVDALRDDTHDQVTSATYDQRGLTSTSTDALGFVTRNAYSAFGQLISQTRTIAKASGSGAERTTTSQFAYDLDGRLVTSTADVGGVSSNSVTVYDAFGRAIQSTNALGNSSQTQYKDSGRTVVVTDALGRSVRTEFDALGRVLRQFDALNSGGPNGKATVFSYDDVNRTVTVTTPEGIIVTTTKNAFGETLSVRDGRGNLTRYEYDQDGHATAVTDALGNRSVNAYDNKGRLATVTDARGTVTTFTYDELNRVFTRQVDSTGLNLTTRYEFDALGQQVKVTEASGTSAQRITTYSYDAGGHVLRVVVDPDHSDGSAGLNLTTTYAYDGLGNAVQVSQGTVASPNQQVMQYVFDGLGRRVKEIAAPSSVLGAGSASARDLTTEYRYDANGQVSRKIDANGQSTWFVHDAAGQLVYTINALGEVSQNYFDANGRVIQTRRYVTRLPAATVAAFGDGVSTVTPTANTNDQRVYVVYDADGRQRFTVRAEISSYWSVTENRYDANGNVVEARRYEKLINDADASADKALDTTGAGVSLSQVTSVLRALGYTETALGSTTTDETTLSGVVRTRFAYDADNRQRFVIDALGDVSEAVYDAAGNVVAQVSYAGRPVLTSFSESAVNAAVNRLDPANRVTHLAYDRAGRLRFTALVTAVDSQGRPTQQVIGEKRYDALGQNVLTISYASMLGAVNDSGGQADYSEAAFATALAAAAPNAQDRRLAMVYDAAGREVYAVQVASISGSGQATAHFVTRKAYDALGHLVLSTSYAQAIGALSDYRASTLDAAVNAASVANAAGNRSTRFAYDAAGRLRFTVAADGSLAESVYDALGQVVESRRFDVRVPAGLSTNEATLVTLRAGRRVGDGVTRGESYTYDAAGRRLRTTDAQGAVEVNEYDGLGNRVAFSDRNTGPTTDATRKWRYTYDRAGRLFQQFTPVVTAQRSDGSIVSQSIETRFYYDALGNLFKKVEAVSSGDDRITQYVYDKLGRQTMTVLPGWYDPTTGRVESRVETGNPTGRFARTLETAYDALGNVVRTKLRTGATTYQYEYKTYDTLGRLVHDIDALNHVTAFAYDAFGDQVSATRYSVAISGAPANGSPQSGGYWTLSDILATQSQLASDAQARTVTMSYDNLGRKIRVTQPVVTGSYYYSSAAASVNAATVPSVTSAGVTSYDYDAFGDLIHESTKVSDNGSGGTWRDTWHYFDVMDREIRTIDAAGYHTARSFDAFGNLTAAIEYANAGALGSTASRVPPSVPVAGDRDRITEFAYDAMNRQTTVTRKNVRYAVLQSDGSYADVGTGRDGGVVMQSTTYDALGHVKTQTDALGNTTTRTYDAAGQLSSVTEPARQVALAGALDPFHSLVTVSPVTSFTYNFFGQVVSQTRSSGGAAPALTTLQSYDAAGNLVSTTDANGNTRFRQYDYAGRLSKETQAIHSVLGQRISPSNATVTWQIVDFTTERRYTYDALGRQIGVTDVFRDEATGLSQQSGQGTVFNAFGEITDEQRVWGAADATFANLTKARVVHYDYDTAGHVIGKRAADGVYRFFYDLAGQVTRQEQVDPNASDGVDPTRVTETAFDLLGRAILQRAPRFTYRVADGFDGAKVYAPITPISEQGYDRWGNVVSRTQGSYVRGDNLALDTSARTTTTYEYNQDNQVVAEHLPTVIAYRADGSSYQANVTHGLHYDIAGRSVEETDTVAGQSGTLRTRSRTYDAAGNVLSQTDATQITMQYAYDANGRRVGTRNAQGTVFVDTFDNNGNVLTHSVLRKTDRLSSYNSFTDATAVAVVLNTYQYDQANHRVASEAKVDAVNSALGNWTFTQYDERNFARANFQIRLSNGGGTPVAAENGRETNRCSYDVFGNKTRETDAAGNVQTWAYNWSSNWTDPSDPAAADYSVGRLTQATAGSRTTQYAYNAFGQVSKETYSGADLNAGTLNDRIYNYLENGLLRQVEEHQNYGTGADFWNSHEFMSYEYSSKGERTMESFHRDGSYGLNTSTGQHLALATIDRETDIAYDAQGRVRFLSTTAPTTSRSSLSGIEYRYDELGNRREILASYTVRRVYADGQSVYGGSASTDRWYDYDREGRMTVVDGEVSNGQFVVGHGTTTVSYDSLGRRSGTQKWDSSGHYDANLPPGEGDIIDDYDNYRRESYGYDDLDHLTSVSQSILAQGTSLLIPSYGGLGTTQTFSHQGNWLVTTSRVYDLLGEETNATYYTDASTAGSIHDPETYQSTNKLSRITSSVYDSRGFLNRQSTRDLIHADHGSLVFNNYDDGGVLRSYTYIQGEVTHPSLTDIILNPVFSNVYTYDYSMQAGGMKETRITINSTQSQQNGVTRNRYDARGNLVRQTIDTLSTNHRQEQLFGYDLDGHILTKDVIDTNTSNSVIGAAGGNQDYFFGGGRLVGSIGSGDLASTTQFGNNFTPISAAYPASSPSNYPVQSGDTLSSIAQTVYGDGSLWYLIGDANSLNAGPYDALTGSIGRSLRVPNVVANLHSNSSTFQPYNLGSIIGSGVPTPGLPNPPSTQCISAEQIVVGAVVVAAAIAATVVTQGVAAGVLGESLLASMASAGLGAAAGSAASQLTSIALTDRGLSDFSGTAVLEAGLAGALGGAVSNMAAADFGKASLATRTFDAAGSFLTQAAVHSAIANEFDPNSFYNLVGDVAAAALIAPTFQKLDGAYFKPGSSLQQLAMGAAGPNGWAYRDNSRNWETLISQAVNAGTRVVVGGVLQSAMAPQPGEEEKPSGPPVPDETGDSDFAYLPDAISSADAAAAAPASAAESADDGTTAGDVSAAAPTYADPTDYTSGRKDRTFEDIAERFYGKEYRWLGTAIAVSNGIDTLGLRPGMALKILPFDQIDLDKARVLRAESNDRESRIISQRAAAKAAAAAAEAARVEAEQKKAVETEKALQKMNTPEGALAYHLEQDGLFSDEQACFRPGYGDEIRENVVRDQVAKAQELQQQAKAMWDKKITTARVIADAYDVPLEFVLNDDYKPPLAMRLPPVQFFAMARDMVGWDAVGGRRDGHYLSEYARNLSIDWDLNAVEGEYHFSSAAYAQIALQIAANAVPLSASGALAESAAVQIGARYLGAGLMSVSLGSVANRAIDGQMTGSDWAELGGNLLFAAAGYRVMQSYGKVQISSPTLEKLNGVASRIADRVATEWNFKSVPQSALDDAVGFARARMERDLEAGGNTSFMRWDPEQRTYVDGGAWEPGTSHLIPECVDGACGLGTTSAAERLGQLGVPRNQIYIVQAEKIDPAAQHYTLVVRTGRFTHQIVDTTYAQFLSPQRAGPSVLSAAGELGTQLRTDLLGPGYTPLTSRMVNTYMQSIATVGRPAPVSVGDFTARQFNWGQGQVSTHF